MEISPISENIRQDKDAYIVAAEKILNHYGCSISAEGIGNAIDKWKKSQDVVEQEMIDCLGFLLGDLCINSAGGKWVMVTDSYGTTPAIQTPKEENISFVLDSVSKRLRDNSEAKREIPSVMWLYQKNASE